MHNIVGGLRNFGLYLLPVSLLALCGTLLTALMYDPTPPSVHPPAVTDSSSAVLTDKEYSHTHVDEMFMMLLIDALRQSQIPAGTQAQTLRYRLPLENDPSLRLLRTAPSADENNRSDCPALIRL